VLELLTIISSGTIQCDNQRDGSCIMPLACSDYVNFEDYVFVFNFTGAADNYHVEVPLGTFTYNVKQSGGAA